MSKKNSNNKIYIIIVACAVAIAAIITAIIVVITNKKSEPVTENIFESSDKRIVMNIGADDPEAQQLGATEMYQLFNTDGERIVSGFLYIVFDDEVKAIKASVNADLKNAVEAKVYKSITRDDKYIILELPQEMYANMTTSQLREAAAEFSAPVQTDEEEYEDVEVVEKIDEEE